jgi:hypothetical protein
MVRMQIQFTEEEIEALRRAAAQRHMSISAVVRKAVDDSLVTSAKPSREELVRRSLAAMGRFADSILD